MSTRIIYSQTTQTGKSVAQMVNDVLTARSSAERVMAVLNAAASGNDWAAVAAEVGGGISVQQAQDLWTILSTATGVITGPQVAELSRLDQG